MSVISIVHTKGGVGKTTSAIHLATAAARQGREAIVLDADPQVSAANWWADAALSGDPLPFDVPKVAGEFKVPDRELVIIDTPPGTALVIDYAIMLADIVIIPCGPSPLDVQRVFPTIGIVPEGKLYGILMTGVDLRANFHDKVRAEIEGEGHPVFDTMVLQRQRTRRSYGTTPTYMNGYADVLREIDGVLAYV